MHVDKNISLLHCYSSLEAYKEFQEECYSIALHPSGLYILVGFSDKLRLMNLLIDDIRSFKEFTIRGCREVLIYYIMLACSLKEQLCQIQWTCIAYSTGTSFSFLIYGPPVVVYGFPVLYS